MCRLGVFAEVRGERIDGGEMLNTKRIYYSLHVCYKGAVLMAMHCFLLPPNPEQIGQLQYFWTVCQVGLKPFPSWAKEKRHEAFPGDSPQRCPTTMVSGKRWYVPSPARTSPRPYARRFRLQRSRQPWHRIREIPEARRSWQQPLMPPERG